MLMSILVYSTLISSVLESPKLPLITSFFNRVPDMGYNVIAIAKPRTVIPASRTINKYAPGKKDLKDKIRRFLDLRPTKLA